MLRGVTSQHWYWWYSQKMQKPIISAVAAIGRNRELGKDNKLLWHIPDDMKRFKSLTKGHPLILGRKTFESIVGYAGGSLPNRTSIVISHRSNTIRQYAGYPGVIVVGSLEEALARARTLDGVEIFIGGGAEVYKEALPSIDKLYLTLIDAEAEADTFFPLYEHLFTKKVFEEEHEWKGTKYRFIDRER